MKKFLTVTILIISLLLVSCVNPINKSENVYSYSGERKELYTVAISSLLWNKGVSSQADRVCDPDIKIIDEDGYGRILFEYTERSFTSDVAFSSMIIMQHSTESHVYYYEDINFISKEKVSHSNVKVEFDVTAVEYLKEANDWNKELNLEKCTVKDISNTKKQISIEKSKLKDIFSTYDGYYSNSILLLTKDDYGRAICYGWYTTLENNTTQNHYIVILFQEDLSYSIFAPNSMYDYQEEFKEFKKANHWNVKC